MSLEKFDKIAEKYLNHFLKPPSKNYLKTAVYSVASDIFPEYINVRITFIFKKPFSTEESDKLFNEREWISSSLKSGMIPSEFQVYDINVGATTLEHYENVTLPFYEKLRREIK